MHHKNLWPVLCEDTGEIIANYALYIQSNHWKRIKVLCKHSSHHKGKCYVCGNAEKLDLHHKTYERIGHEDLTDLQELCELCHGLVHQLAMTGRQLGITIGNAADAMLGDNPEGGHRYTSGGRQQYSNTSQKVMRKRRKKRSAKPANPERRAQRVVPPDPNERPRTELCPVCAVYVEMVTDGQYNKRCKNCDTKIVNHKGRALYSPVHR